MSCVVEIRCRVNIVIILFFFFNDTATTEIYTLSLHDALPISTPVSRKCSAGVSRPPSRTDVCRTRWRSEEHTSELQSHSDLVCRLLLEKKKIIIFALSPYMMKIMQSVMVS